MVGYRPQSSRALSALFENKGQFRSLKIGHPITTGWVIAVHAWAADPVPPRLGGLVGPGDCGPAGEVAGHGGAGGEVELAAEVRR